MGENDGLFEFHIESAREKRFPKNFDRSASINICKLLQDNRGIRPVNFSLNNEHHFEMLNTKQQKCLSKYCKYKY